MRFNKQELITLATQPSTKFEKEGVLYIRERQEGFFRKSESEYSNFFMVDKVVIHITRNQLKFKYIRLCKQCRFG